ncbi:MAG TPA: hypothetical protein VGY56_02955 [Verrucomicrobiae bacterium]|nr:hypothetical protein [Verrucomicrobiae bacterium]
MPRRSFRAKKDPQIRAALLASGATAGASPVFFVENHPEAHYFGFLGMVIKASKFLLQAQFIGGPIIFQMLDKIIEDQQTDAKRAQLQATR